MDTGAHIAPYIYLYSSGRIHGLITAARYPNCRHFLACYMIPVLIRSFVGNPFRHRGRKFMGFLHEITRKHNPCSLRRMSVRLLRRFHSFPPSCYGLRLSFTLFMRLSLLSPILSAFYPRAFARLIALET